MHTSHMLDICELLLRICMMLTTDNIELKLYIICAETYFDASSSKRSKINCFRFSNCSSVSVPRSNSLWSCLSWSKNFPCRFASLPGDTPTSAATLLCLSATGVDGPDFLQLRGMKLETAAQMQHHNSSLRILWSGKTPVPIKIAFKIKNCIHISFDFCSVTLLIAWKVFFHLLFF